MVWAMSEENNGRVKIQMYQHGARPRRPHIIVNHELWSFYHVHTVVLCCFYLFG